LELISENVNGCNDVVLLHKGMSLSPHRTALTQKQHQHASMHQVGPTPTVPSFWNWRRYSQSSVQPLGSEVTFF